MTNAASKEEVKFSGKPDKGLTFEEFDLKTLSWARKEYGNKYAKQLWEDNLMDIRGLDLTEDFDYYQFTEHCEFVYDMLCLDSIKNADALYQTAKFWTVKWQLESRQRQYEKLFCFLETICHGEAGRQLQALGVEKTRGMRKHFFERFGTGQPQVLQERVRKYLLGMPDKNGVAFPPRVNMADKLDALEEERNFLLRMCPKEKHKDYDEGKETTLVRLILNTLPAEYDNAVHHVRNLMAIREMVKGGDLESITNVDDAVKINYDTSWLPPYKELRVGLVNAWLSKKRRWDEEKSSRSKEGHPTLMMCEDKNGDKTCFGCGMKGHVRGAPECKAGSDAIWSGAPKAYLEKVRRKYGKTPAIGKRPVQEGQKPICKFHQEGYCKYAERCHFEHDGQGGSKRPKGNGKGKGKGKSKGKGKGRGKGRGKGIGNRSNTTMVVEKKKRVKNPQEDFESSMMVGKKHAGSEDDDTDNEGDESKLYNLMRGYTTMMITGADGEESDEGGEEESLDESVIVPPTQEDTQEWGSTSSSVPGWGSSRSMSSSVQGWEPTYTPAELRRWQSSWNFQREDEEEAKRWEETGRRSLRQRRDQEMEGGRSPPPKLKEENIFSEGDSRRSSRPAYQVQESKDNWGWGDDTQDIKKESMSSIFGKISEGTFDPNNKRKSDSVRDDGWKRYVKRPTISDVEKVSKDSSESSGEDQSEGEDDDKEESLVIPHSPARGE